MRTEISKPVTKLFQSMTSALHLETVLERIKFRIRLNFGSDLIVCGGYTQLMEGAITYVLCRFFFPVYLVLCRHIVYIWCKADGFIIVSVYLVFEFKADLVRNQNG